MVDERYLNDEDDDGSIGTIEIGKVDFLSDESEEMDIERRKIEQQGHRQFGTVNAKDRDISKAEGNELENISTMRQHPLLDSQRFDGIDPDVSPSPQNNPQALDEYNNQKNKQELQKQLRLGHSLKNTPSPRPQ